MKELRINSIISQPGSESCCTPYFLNPLFLKLNPIRRRGKGGGGGGGGRGRKVPSLISIIIKMIIIIVMVFIKKQSTKNVYLYKFQ